VGLCQTVVLNEVSNGPSGNMEYMELVVIPTEPVEPCTPPVCLDLRGWMIDDNNGLHGAGGVAPGAARFSANALWSCVPVGTVIALYNGSDPNSSLPPDDLDAADGNCSIVVSAENPAYFEYTSVTPAAVACSDPGGWGGDGSPTWQNNMAFANTGDCARVSDAAGCEVFTLCYGNTTLNATVAFGGGGQDRVWYFNSGDPYSAAAWSMGCAGDIGNCGSDDQTPGSANNAANAAWLATMGNGCIMVVEDPLIASAEAAPACGCNGTAAAGATGSTAPYTFEWYDAAWVPIGQPTPAAVDLCAGIYHVIVTSASGCTDTATVDVQEVLPPDPGTDAAITLCAGDAPIDLLTVLGGTPQPGGTWSPTLPGGSFFDPATDAPDAYVYSVTGDPPCTDASATVLVTVASPPLLTVTVTDATCFDANDGTILVEVDPPGDHTFTWSGGLPDAPSQSGLPSGEWTVDVTGPDGCTTAASITVGAPDPIMATTTATPAACGNPVGTACAEIEGGVAPWTVVWDDPAAQTDLCATGLAPGTYTATITDAHGCIATADVQVPDQVTPIVVTADVTDVLCNGGLTGTIALTIAPEGDYDVQWSGPEGFEANGLFIQELGAGNYTYFITSADNCTAEGSASVDEPSLLTLEVTVTDETCGGLCDGAVFTASAGGTGVAQLLLDGAPVPPGDIPDLCPGGYTVTAVDAMGCVVSADVLIAAGAPSIVAEALPAGPFCEQDDPQLLIATPPGGTWSGNGVIVPTSLFDPSIAGPGEHVVTYDLEGACTMDATLTIAVSPSPEAGILLPLPDQGSTVVLNTSTGATAYQWWVDGVEAGNGMELVIDPVGLNDEGAEVSICLAAYNGPVCADSVCTLFERPLLPALHVPNAFTPDDDDINDGFGAVLSGMRPESFELIVFDRWGSALFTASEPGTAWDGTSDGRPVPIGVYPWRIRLVAKGSERILLGHVTLVR
jgi:gliding motility-associated-like protein